MTKATFSTNHAKTLTVPSDNEINCGDALSLSILNILMANNNTLYYAIDNNND
ncbi:hypothetical protein [Rhizosphaericola mali]|nr:hypothetical protein [Rhizosphaericola mali]